MPEYRYQAKQGPEKLIEGVIEAASETAAIEKISQQGYVPVMISLENKIKKEAAGPRSGAKADSQKVYLFSNSLARLLKSGVPVLKAVYFLALQEKDHEFRAVLETVERHIREGQTLSKAMSAFPRAFSPMVISVLRSGEMSGKMQEALIQLVEHFKKQREFSSKVRKALAYPIVLVTAGILSIFFVITFLVPKLQKVFMDMGQALPLPTRIVLGLGAMMQRYGLVFVAVLGFLVFFVPGFLKSRVGKYSTDAFKLKMPFVGDLIQKIEFARFSRMLSLCLASGIPFVNALHEVIPSVGNAVIRNKLEECRQIVENGGSFAQAIKKHEFFSSMAVNLIAVGEESGRIEETLVDIAEIYEQETDERLMVLTTLLEPLMILFIGGIIGFIVMAVLLPVFEINAAF